MKKIIILVLVVLAAAALPIVGQKITQSKLDSKIDELKTYGLVSNNTSLDSSYLSTSNHYEFKLEDSDKFLDYLSSLTGDKLPPYTKSLLDGVVIGVDISYSNLAFASDVVMEIYPLKMPEKAGDDLLAYDSNLYSFVEKLLQDKAMLYHINYSLASKDFDGYVKDIDETFVDKNAQEVRFQILGLTYVGNGSLLKPQSVQAKMDKIAFISNANGKKASLLIEGLKTSTNYKTQTTYTSSGILESMKVDIDGDYNMHAAMNKMSFDVSADTQDSKAMFSAKTSVKDFKITSDQGNGAIKDFNYDITLKDIDKDAFEEFRVLVTKMDAMPEPQVQAKLQENMANLFSKGLTIDLKDFSLGEFELYNQKSAKGFSLKSNIVLKADKDFAQKLKTFPALLANNLTIDTVFKISKGMYTLLTKEVPVTTMAKGFAKEDGDYYVFDIKFKDSKLSVNGRAL